MSGVCELGKKLDSHREMHGAESGVGMMRKLGNIKSLLCKILVCLCDLGLEKRELEHVYFWGRNVSKQGRFRRTYHLRLNCKILLH